MKKLILLSILLIVGCVFAQDSPCEDENYLELKKKKLDEMSDREYEYFTRKDKECSDFNKNNTIEKVTTSNPDKTTYKPKFNSYGGLMYAEDGFASLLYYRIENNWGVAYLHANNKMIDDEDIFNTSINGLLFTYDITNKSKIFTPQFILGILFMKYRWEETNWNASDSFTTISPLIGGALYVHLHKNISIGILPVLAQNTSYTMYSDGTTKITDKELQLYPVVSFGVNF